MTAEIIHLPTKERKICLWDELKSDERDYSVGRLGRLPIDFYDEIRISENPEELERWAYYFLRDEGDIEI